MANQQLILSGQVIFGQNSLPISGVRIELWDSANTYGLVASTYSDAKGNFSLYINSPLSDLISNATITPLYKTFRGNTLITNTKTVQQNQIFLTINRNDYDGNVPDVEEHVAASYIDVHGRVLDANGVAVNSVTVNVYEKGFRTEVLLGQTTTNISGEYIVKIKSRDVVNATILADRSIIVKAFSGSNIIAIADNIYLPDSSELVVDLSTAGHQYLPQSQFENIISKITYVLAGTTFASFAAGVQFNDNVVVIEKPEDYDYPAVAEGQTGAADGDSNGELSYVARASGLDLSTVQVITKTYQMAAATSIGHDFMYAFAVDAGITLNPVLSLNEDAMRTLIDNAIHYNAIPDHNTQEKDNCIAAAKSFQVAAAKAIPIIGETYGIGTVLNSIFGGQNAAADTTDFLQKYNNAYDSIDDFWQYYSSISPQKAERAQMGLRVAEITGFQPEMTKNLTGEALDDGLHSLATFSEQDWFDYITDISQQAQKLCVPVSIKGNLTDPTEIKTLYAKKIRSIVQDQYPLTALNVILQDGQQGPAIISDQQTRQEVIAFIGNNPGFDLRVSSIYDINDQNQAVDLTGVTDVEAAQQAMAPMQRMLRLVGGNPTAVARLITDSLGSYSAIAAVPTGDFVAAYSSVLGGADSALAASATAAAYSTAAAGTFVNLHASNAQNQIAVLNWPANNQQNQHLDPNIKTLFGSTSYCACEQCLSVYSPAAYYTDILNFLKAGIPGSPAPDLYNELVRRRPDMPNIDMTCKNTNTLMPYIDLVIELLEGLVLKGFLQTNLPPSYQTSGTAKELAAHPEHVYKESAIVSGVYTWSYHDYLGYVDVYNTPLISGNKNLTNVVYPFNLPFSLPAEETRTYLGHLGYSRYDMMKMFQPYYSPTSISDFDIYSELLGLTEESAKIVANSHSLIANTWEFYGFSASSVTNFIDPADLSAPLISDTWDHLLSNRMDVLIQQLKISYKDFLQFLTSDFLNKPVSGTRQITVTSKDLSKPDTCDLALLKLVFTGSATTTTFFNKLHRFVRLWHTNRMSINEWDKMFTSLLITTLNTTDFALIGRVLQFCDKTGMKPTEATGWWYYMDIHQYVDYASELQTKQPSVYDLLYRNRAVINAPLLEFKDLGGYDPTALPSDPLPAHYSGYTAQIAAANNIAETDLLLLLTYMGITSLSTTAVTLGALSELYFISTLSKKIGYTISDLLKLMYLLNIPMSAPVTVQSSIAGRLDNLNKILSAVDAINNSSLTFLEIDFLVENYSETGPAAAAPLNIQFFLEKLRNELQKFPIYEGPPVPVTPDDITAYNKLANLIYQAFSKEFSTPSEWASTFITPTNILLFIDGDFVNSTVPLTPNEAISLDLYKIYKLAFKLALITQKFRLNSPEFQYFYLNPGVFGSGFNLNLPVTGLATHPTLGYLFNGLLQMSRWVNVRDKLSLIEDQLVQLIKAANNVAADVHVSMAAWQKIINRDVWGTMLIELIGNPATISASTPAGLLSARFPDDFVSTDPASISKLWGMIGIMAGCLRTGLKPATLQAALFQGLTMSDSHQVLLAAKGKHTEDEWSAIAKPLRDTLRTKQRDALVGFVVAHPKPTGSNIQKWRNENDLYAFLLIDIEMEACMKTSRIKQAICSAQLYIDRMLLGLEYRNGNAADRIIMPANMQNQWVQWRAWYRVWEANRKVFLYPENWIEPELRDDKSVFFTEMEDKLFQSDVTKERVEDALFEYTKKLQEVAKLEPMALCDNIDPVTQRVITHVVARTYTDPHKYFYRRLVNNEWTAWERMEIEVKGEHLTMIVWNNQLYLFWLTMRERQVPARASVVSSLNATGGGPRSKWFFNDLGKPNGDSSINESSPVFIKQIEITINWSEYKDSHWTDQQVGKEKMYLDLNPIINKYYTDMFADPGFFPAANRANMIKLYKFLSNNRQLNIAELVMARFNVTSFVAQGFSSILIAVQMAHELQSEKESSLNLQSFIFTKDKGPIIWQSWYGGVILSAPRTAFKNNKSVNWYKTVIAGESGPAGDNEVLWIGNLIPVFRDEYVYPGEDTWINLKEPFRENSAYILNKSPHGTYSVVGHSSIYWAFNNILARGFFYNDDKYGFFARPIDLPASGGVSLASASEAAAKHYYSGIKLNTLYGGSIVTTSVHQTGKFYFQSFFHGRVNDFISALNSGGVDGFMKIQTQDQADTLNFSTYVPTGIVYTKYPKDRVEFGYDEAYAVYNWELFFHMPLLVAKRLSDNQQFEEARKWYHYIFDPTCNIDQYGSITNSKARFWRFRPFYDMATAVITSVGDLLMQIHLGNAAALDQLRTWMDNPFKPHIIARIRIIAYMKNVVMCYMDNLIAWADNLYRQDTIESINQATNLYIVVANILGDKPQEVPKRLTTGPRTFQELADAGLDAFSNAMVAVENYIDPNSGPLYAAGGPTKGETPPLISLFYYCLPNNPKLLAYWDTIANRLFNIRNCRNISGQLRELPLYDAPIDPALLVRAAAAGIDAGSVLDDLTSPPMPYRFNVILQKANELCNDVKALGGALLSALEKKDAEELALLRSSQEIAVLESMKIMKQAMIDEAAANIEAMNKSKDVAQVRYAYYSSRPYKTPREAEHLALMDASQQHQNTASTLSAVGSILSILPEVNIQAPFAIGPSFGGRELSAVFSALSTIQSQKAAAKSAEANKALTEAGYERRRDDWVFQADSAQKEMIQIDKQILAAQIRKSIAEKDLATQILQIANAKATDEYMHEKYTNLELYSWMVGQVSSTYFQVYQFAYDVAKRAEKCLNFEVPWINTPGTGFIRFGYWDSLKKGLMSGEKMQYDLRKMELAYLEANTRELELTKHISLAMENPAQLIALRESGMFELECDQNMFDFDYPGHYARRIKSVSISIPCVAGPYITIAATLKQSDAWIEDSAGGLTGTFTSQSVIALSGAQNDSGMFELNLRDERYLPFEGSGAICTWTLSLMDDKTLRQFDYNMISDVIIHVKYTAQESDSKRTSRTTILKNALNSIGGPGLDLYRYFSLRHEFANAWFAYASAIETDITAQMVINLDIRLFPYFCQKKNIGVKSWDIWLRSKGTLTQAYTLEVIYNQSGSHTVDIEADDASPYYGHGSLVPAAAITPSAGKTFSLRLINPIAIPSPVPVDMNALLDDIYLVATYNLSLP